MSKNKNEVHGLFKVTQNIFLVNDKNQLLVLKHISGNWLLVGGRLNENENWRDGLRREVREETSIENFEIERIVEVDNWVHNDMPHFGVFYMGRVNGEVEIVLSEEHCDSMWIKSIEELESLTFWHEGLKNRVRNFYKNSLLN